MADAYKTIAHEWFEEVWNRRNRATISRLYAANGTAHGLGHGGAVIRGPDEFKPFYEAFLSAMPDIRVKVLDTVSDGDKLAARCLVTGTHTGNGLGFKATGKKVQFEGVCIMRVSGGQIVEAWNHFDFLGMYQQLGCPAEMLARF